MMELVFVQKRINDIMDQIAKVIISTEDVYGSIHLQLPIIEREIEMTVNEMSILLEYFITADQGQQLKSSLQNNKDGMRLSMVLKQIVDNFNNISAEMVNEEEMRKIMERFLVQDQQSEYGIDQLIKMITLIRKRIIDIEIVSLNAIIYSSRLGDQGKGFGVISDNVMALSNTINHQYTEMGTFASGLNTWNESFTGNVQQLLKCHNRLTNDSFMEFQQLFKMVLESLSQVGMLLEGLISNVEQGVRPIQELMTSIQAQDILRQYLENTSKSLATVDEKIQTYIDAGEATEGKETLRLLVFSEKILEMVHKMVGNVTGEFNKSLQELNEPLTDIRQNLREIQEEGNMVSSFIAGSNSSSEGNTVQEIFVQVHQFIQQLSGELHDMGLEIDGFATSSEDFYYYMEGVGKKVKEIKGKIGFLDKLKLMSRIELARLHQEHSSFGEEITRVTELVISEVNQNEKFILNLQQRLEGDLQHFDQVMVLNRQQLTKMAQVVINSQEEVVMIEGLVAEAVQALGGASNKLIEEVDQIAANLELGAQMPHELTLVEELLAELRQGISDKKLLLASELGYQDWNEMGGEYQDVLDNFTTYLERLTASNVLDDVDLDVGSEAGDLVLF